MIAEVDPDRYDVSGHKVFRPDQRRQGLRSTAPFGRYVSQPLSVHCKNLEELRRFLAKCRQVSDQEQFGKRDYWQPPDEFEKTRKATVIASLFGLGDNCLKWVKPALGLSQAEPVAFRPDMPGSPLRRITRSSSSNPRLPLLERPFRGCQSLVMFRDSLWGGIKEGSRSMSTNQSHAT